MKIRQPTVNLEPNNLSSYKLLIIRSISRLNSYSLVTKVIDFCQFMFLCAFVALCLCACLNSYLETKIFELCNGKYANLSELAQAMGISVSQIYRVQHGKRHIF